MCAAIVRSQRLAITLEALARSYDHVVIDAGALPDTAAERLPQLAPRAVLVADALDEPDQRRRAGAARSRRVSATVSVLQGGVGAWRGRVDGARRGLSGASHSGANHGGMKKTIIRTGLETLYFSGAHQMLRPFVGGVGAILTLHHVRPPRPDRFQPNRLLEVTPRIPRRGACASCARSELDIVSLDEMHRRLIEGDFRRRFVCITIDDGYRDTLEWAYPILQAHRGAVHGLYPDQLSRPAGRVVVAGARGGRRSQ